MMDFDFKTKINDYFLFVENEYGDTPKVAEISITALYQGHLKSFGNNPYGQAELNIALNYGIWRNCKTNEELAKIYDKLWKEHNDYIFDKLFKEDKEKLETFIKITD